MNRSNKSINRTLLILLGIILACILTLNARSFYSADTLSIPGESNVTLDKNASTDVLKKISTSSIEGFIEKISSLK